MSGQSKPVETPREWLRYAEGDLAVAEREIESDEDIGKAEAAEALGASVAANKMRGIRAGVCHDTYSAHQGVEHDDMNVLTLGARIIGPELVPELVCAFLAAKFTGEERHVRRLGKIKEMEEKG
jgi:ribose 5-phosphate isomerase B